MKMEMGDNAPCHGKRKARDNENNPHSSNIFLDDQPDCIAINVECSGRILRNRKPIAVYGLHGDVIDQVDGDVDRMVVVGKAHVRMDCSAVPVDVSVCPSDIELPTRNPYFDSDPDAYTRCIVKVSVTILQQLPRCLMIHRNLNDNIWIRPPIRKIP